MMLAYHHQKTIKAPRAQLKQQSGAKISWLRNTEGSDQSPQIRPIERQNEQDRYKVKDRKDIQKEKGKAWIKEQRKWEDDMVTKAWNHKTSKGKDVQFPVNCYKEDINSMLEYTVSKMPSKKRGVDRLYDIRGDPTLTMAQKRAKLEEKARIAQAELGRLIGLENSTTRASATGVRSYHSLVFGLKNAEQTRTMGFARKLSELLSDVKAESQL
ncbi:MAG: hypothetical protein M1812_007381 [Candelaria pacifica]|nr:MAG: hypothetical protein M1812_007381 [Candelaria pacifica]